eukprot:TRINITY_DN2029_c0_g1_i1.p1 TRINITY_DN2029_c0_g1~~TRINITY_DN2029_c0_g1_i1.p1  ORF type:complete len:332 (+),score=185.05 TRINITY_DN2029_c0_g1_i1:28-996(+)
MTNETAATTPVAQDTTAAAAAPVAQDKPVAIVEAPKAAAPKTAAPKAGAKKNEPLAKDNIDVVSDKPLSDDAMKRFKVAIGRGDKATDAKFIVNQTGKKEILNKDNLRIKSTLYIKDCTDCEFTVDAKCVKVMIEGCTNVTLNLNSIITTSVAEVWKCNNVSIFIRSRIDTFQVDMSTKVLMDYQKRDMINSIIWAGVHDLNISIPDGAGGRELFKTGFAEMIPVYEDIREDFDQFIIRIVDGKMVSEQVVRLENGFPTTEREAKAFDEKAEKNKLAADKHLRKLVKSMETKHGSGAVKPGRNDDCSCGSGKKFKKCCANKK